LAIVVRALDSLAVIELFVIAIAVDQHVEDSINIRGWNPRKLQVGDVTYLSGSMKSSITA